MVIGNYAQGSERSTLAIVAGAHGPLDGRAVQRMVPALPETME